jgi:hypothetical protein
MTCAEEIAGQDTEKRFNFSLKETLPELGSTVVRMGVSRTPIMQPDSTM